MSTRQKTKIWTILSLIASLLIIIFISLNYKNLQQFVYSAGVWAPIVSILLFGALSFTPIPADPLAVINGIIFGPLIGSLVVWMGNNFAALTEYFFGLGLHTVINFEKQKKKLPFGLDKLPVNSIKFLTLARLIPGFGSKFVSITAGIYRVPIRRYLWTSALTNLLGAMIYAFGGFGLLALFHH